MNVEESEPVEEKKPLSVLILAWGLLLFALLQIFQIPFNYDDFSFGRNLWHFVIKFGLIIAAIGFIQFKRWGVYLYFSIFMTFTLTFYILPPTPITYEIFISPPWILFMVAIPTVISLVILPHWKQFN